FDSDFGHVRIHAADADRAAAARLGARAFTHGRHIWLGPGESVTDKRLMAHELTHVVQQTGLRRPKAAARAIEPRQPVARAEAPIRRGWLRDKADSIARHIPGYTLLCVLLGKSPINDRIVPRTAENLIGGLMGLVPGGTVLFDQLQQAGVVTEAVNWVSAKLSELDLSWARIKRVISQAIDDFSIRRPIASLKPAFAPLFSDIASFAVAMKDKIIELIIKGALKLAGSYGQQIWEVINEARDTIKLVLDDPLRFAKNLLASVVKGFGQFAGNILDHLKRGLLGWLFGAIEGADLKMPDKLDLKGLLSIGFQLVGLSWDRVRKKIVKKLDPHGEMKVGFLEKAVDVLKILVTQGFVGIWQRMLDYIDSFKTTVVEGIKGYVMSSVVQAGIGWLAGLSNPVGAIIKLAIAIYDVIVVFIERWKQIMDVAKSLFASIKAIALGNIQAAADRIEQTIGRTVPVVISFIAGLLRLNGISGKIREIIKKLRTPVDKAIDKVLTLLVKKAKKLFSKLISKLNRKRKLPQVKFQFGKREHTLLAEKKGGKVQLAIATKKKPIADHKKDAEKAAGETKDPAAKKAAKGVASEVAETDKEAGAAAKKLKPDSKKDNQLANTKKLEAEMKEAAAELEAEGRSVDTFMHLDTSAGDGLFRAREPRFSDVEGQSASYRERGKATSQPIMINKQPAPSGEVYSVYYENDHLPEKQYAKAIFDNLDSFKPTNATGKADRGTEKAAAPPQKKEETKPSVGQLGLTIGDPGKEAPDFPSISIYRPVHLAKGATRGDEAKRKVAEAAKSTAKGGPVAAIKTLLKAQIFDESNRIAKLVRQDKSADGEVKAAIDKGLAQVAKLGSEIYGLDKVEAATAAAGPKQAGDKETNLAEIPFTGAEPDVPDFTKVEGDLRPYGKFVGKYGKYMEYDHVIEAAYPKHAKALTFGHDQLRQKIKDGLKGDADKPEVKARLSDLGSRQVFTARHGIAKYQHPAGPAIALYRPIHRMVTADSRIRPPGSVDPIAAAVSGSFVKPMLDYVRDGDAAGLDKARIEVGKDVKTLFTGAAAAHTDVIAQRYLGEMGNAEAVNPGHKTDAKHAMVVIVGRVQQSLQAARASTSALFD
ncbi:MAG: DUF4157 domain-containing protein, partial [Devosia sp.]